MPFAPRRPPIIRTHTHTHRISNRSMRKAMHGTIFNTAESETNKYFTCLEASVVFFDPCLSLTMTLTAAWEMCDGGISKLKSYIRQKNAFVFTWWFHNRIISSLVFLPFSPFLAHDKCQIRGECECTSNTYVVEQTYCHHCLCYGNGATFYSSGKHWADIFFNFQLSTTLNKKKSTIKLFTSKLGLLVHFLSLKTYRWTHARH